MNAPGIREHFSKVLGKTIIVVNLDRLDLALKLSEVRAARTTVYIRKEIPWLKDADPKLVQAVDLIKKIIPGSEIVLSGWPVTAGIFPQFSDTPTQWIMEQQTMFETRKS